MTETKKALRRPLPIKGKAGEGLESITGLRLLLFMSLVVFHGSLDVGLHGLGGIGGARHAVYSH
jgi:hypothetical protein